MNNLKIPIKAGKNYNFLSTEEIVRCEASGCYTTLFLKNSSKIVVSKNIKQFEALLKAHYFLRVHSAHLVNTNYIDQLTGKLNCSLKLTDNTIIPVSRRKKKSIFASLLI